jgi:hypothetical protein
MKSLLLCLLLLWGISVKGQKSIAIRANAHFVPFTNIAPKYLVDDPVFRGVSPSIAWARKYGPREHEIGLQFYQRNKGASSDPVYTREWETGISYDNRSNRFTARRVLFLLGYGSRLFYAHGNRYVNTVNDYPSKQWMGGLGFYARPVVRLLAQSPFFLEVSAEAPYLSAYYRRRTVDDPTLLERQRTSAGIDIDLDLIGRMSLSAGFRF